MRLYRGKAVQTGSDISHAVRGHEFLKVLEVVGASPFLPKNGFYITELARKIAGTSDKKSAAYKLAYRKASAKCQYLRKKGVLVNIRYGVWQYVTDK